MNQRRRGQPAQGQALVEFALVFPMAMMVIFGIVVFGLYVFYQQQLTNVAREAARHAAIHSSTAICSTSSWIPPQAPPPTYQAFCDAPNVSGDPYPWPKMTARARSFAWGMNPGIIRINACWSGHRPYGSYPDVVADFPAVDTSGTTPVPNEFIQCTIDGINPASNSQALGCRPRMTTPTDDKASDLAGNQVTVYACFDWAPPLAGVLVIPSTVTLKAIVTEVIHRQQ